MFVFVFLAFLVYYFLNSDSFSLLVGNVKLVYLIPIILFSCVSLFLSALFIKFAVEPFGIDLKEYVGLNLSAMFVNLIAPFKAGAGARAVYMKRKYGLTYSKFVASLMGSYVITIFSISLIALIAMPFLYLVYAVFSWTMLIFFLFACLSCLFVIVFHFKFRGGFFLTVKLNSILEGWELIAKFPKIVLKIFTVVCISSLISSLVIVLTFKSLGFEVPLLKALFINLFYMFSVFINFTPGAIGIQEGLHVFAGNLLGIPVDITFMMSLVLRAINTFLLLICGPIANLILLKRFGVSLRDEI